MLRVLALQVCAQPTLHNCARVYIDTHRPSGVECGRATSRCTPRLQRPCMHSVRPSNTRAFAACTGQSAFRRMRLEWRSWRGAQPAQIRRELISRERDSCYTPFKSSHVPALCPMHSPQRPRVHAMPSLKKASYVLPPSSSSRPRVFRRRSCPGTAHALRTSSPSGPWNASDGWMQVLLPHSLCLYTKPSRLLRRLPLGGAGAPGRTQGSRCGPRALRTSAACCPAPPSRPGAPVHGVPSQNLRATSHQPRAGKAGRSSHDCKAAHTVQARMALGRRLRNTRTLAEQAIPTRC